MPAPDTPLRTMVYVDGFNLYYRCLKGHTGVKWLDLNKVMQNLLPSGRYVVVGIKYFTARVSPTPSDPDIHLRQGNYLQAISKYIPNLTIIEGQFLTHEQWRPLAPPDTGKVRIMHTEEKGTDVNIAVHLLNDAWLDLYDCAVLVSNDSDLTEALRLAKEHGKVIGWLVPGEKKKSWSLSKVVSFQKTIRKGVLELSQLPDPIPGTTLHKPAGW